MPLERIADAVPDLDNLVGVVFPMYDRKRDSRMICFVTYAALCDRAAFDDNGDDWTRAWTEHRSTIELLASAAYDAGKIGQDGRVVVDTQDLTPLAQEHQRPHWARPVGRVS
jgi:hypothetical protein